MTKQERESMLYDKFDKFTSEPGESIHSYYLRFTKLINDMNMIPMSMTPMQINTKFVNYLHPEWSRFVTPAKQARNLHSVAFDQLYAFLKHNERDAKEVREMRQRFPEPLALLANTYNPPPSYIITVQNVQGRQSQGYAGNTRNNQASRTRVINAVGNTGANQPRVITCYNCKGEGHMAKQCTAKKRVKDSEWFKDKMLLAQAQNAGVVLNEEQQDFLADSLDETDDCEDLQLQAIANFKAYYVDVYDSDCDDEATTNAISMANLSPVGSLNDDTVAPRYDSDTLSEVPHYDTYHDSDMLNSNIQELGYIENIVSNNESYDELKGNNDVISYTDYILTIGDDADNYVPPPVQKNDMMLSVIEQMKSQVEKCNKVNQESKSEIKSLTSEIEQYKDRVRVLGYAVKDDHSEQEAYISRELYTLPPVTISKPKVFPKKLPSTSQVLRNLNNARDLLTHFDECIKRRATLYPHEIGSCEQSDIKGAFRADVIPSSENLKETFKLFEKGFITEVKEMKDIFEQMEDEVDQCSMAKKSFEI
ncbi:retrovirus-related pol polyprotein from transposon TNT 1-94 [Tanacetum coccineum]